MKISRWSLTLKNCLDQSLHVFASPHDHPSHLSLPVLLDEAPLLITILLSEILYTHACSYDDIVDVCIHSKVP